MRIDVTPELTGFDGAPIYHILSNPCPACNQAMIREPLTVRLSITKALGNTAASKIPGDKLIENFALGMRIRDEDKPEINIQEAKVIQDAVRDSWNVQVAGQVWMILEAVKDDPSED